MSVTGRSGEVLRQVREALGLQQWQIGELGGRSRNWVTEVEAGRMDGNPSVLALIGRKLKDGRLVAQAARKITGGAFAPPVPDGDSVDLHPVAMAATLCEMLCGVDEQARQLLMLMARPAHSWSDDERSRIAPAVERIVDVERAIQYVTLVIARELDVDVVDFYQAHDRKLALRGYTKDGGGLA